MNILLLSMPDSFEYTPSRAVRIPTGAITFLVDENITLDVDRSASLCQAIVDANLHDVDSLVQAMTAPIAVRRMELGPLMRRRVSVTSSWESRTCSIRISSS